MYVCMFCSFIYHTVEASTSTNSTAFIIAVLGPTVDGYDLLWAICSPRDVLANMMVPSSLYSYSQPALKITQDPRR